ncbi:arsinothricin resistance N-acetyltransferase ArsN1 family A [Alkaliphilus serpentinus]|uniref:N-acetyltransferase n=1 Tax=Alkaliphilus serpentinus TaxID=1482731 RepID=A0A833HN11_9FIRM|nr:arsinothricin resistance N-acetyltransferase ArsN1 family A [Alkaliphilus serpentinus]KAB3529160.1 N-acetyltransferase [Alkaliphilus serpentinus]
MDLRIVRRAELKDVPTITQIYNQGIQSGIATLETRLRQPQEMVEWLVSRGERFKVLVAEEGDEIVGWASLNAFKSRKAYDGVADLSIYIRGDMQGKGVGKRILQELCRIAKEENFHKLALVTFRENSAARALYASAGFREVGIYEKQGRVNDQWIDLTIMEKLLI